MYNLAKFNPRKELKDFETELFVFDTNEQFSLNEKEEKIWSYLVTEKGETLPVIFQIMWFKGQLCISYNTEHAHESIRLVASQMAHRIRAVLRQKVKNTIVLENPIIGDFQLYEKNLCKHSLPTQVSLIEAHLEKNTTDTDQTIEFELYGEDGKILGQALQEKGIASFTPKEGIAHELTIKTNIKNEQCKRMAKVIEHFGYGVIYQEIEAYDVKAMQNLFSSGLIEIEKV